MGAPSGAGARATPLLQRAIQAAKALPEADQDALAAEILEWIDDQRRWSESFARTHEALADLAREALAEHHAGQTPDAVESFDPSPGDAADEADVRERPEEE